MRTYLLFVYGAFENHQDIEFFCLSILGKLPFVHLVRYVIENDRNVIIVFESDENHDVLSEEVHLLTNSDSVKFYFLTERNSMVSVYLPDTINDFIFKPSSSDPLMIKVEYEKNTEVKRSPLELDDVLDKIDLYGIESLTEEEKNFLDNFEK
jgi:hypothetical protein